VPNTLVHFAAQGVASHGLWRRLDPRWIYLGCLLPDVPWILRRVVVGFGVLVDPFDLRLYTMAQASLAGTLLLCAAIAAVTAAPRLVVSVLGLNALLHLLLDATEQKWGNGVHLLAPFSWRMTSFDLVAGESAIYFALALAGALLVSWDIARKRPLASAFDLRPARLAASTCLAMAYFLFPLPFLRAIEESGSYSVKVLREVDARLGRPVSLDRTAFFATPAGGVVQLWTGERVRAVGDLPAHDAMVSLQGTFLAPDVLSVDRLVEHRHDRDWASYLALLLLALVWARPVLGTLRPPPSIRRRCMAGALLGLAAIAFSCSSGREREARVAAAGIAGPSSWELVYERDVNGAMHLFVIPAGGGPERPLTGHPDYDSLARWTPDGRSIVFTSNRSGKPQLWEIDADGRNLRRVRKNGATEYQADVSPDGRQIAFLSDLDGPERLLLQDLRTGAVRVLVRHGERTIFGNPHWSPDGRMIAFSSNHRMDHQVYVVDVATGDERRLSGFIGTGCEPRFSRDGQNVVYVSRGHMWPTSRLVAHDLATGEKKTLVDWPALNYDPVYSPDGSELAFASNITGQYVIYRQRLSDGKAWRVTFAPGEARNPDYRPTSLR
jgi:Tol biopolymer transport system component